MEAKSPFEEIFSSKDEKKKEKKEEDLLDFNASESGEPVPLDTGDRYLNLILELLKNKYFFEAIEVIKEMAGEKV
ncbi:hypothetical protein J7J69_05780 [candidate division WOR-3 bacterium]|nr:hypothetical protein [candidate division WOR-3 bacterium]